MKLRSLGYNADQEVIKCDKCDKPCGYNAIGIDMQISLCEGHSPYANMHEVTFVYIENENYDPHDLMTKDHWVIDLRNKIEQEKDVEIVKP